MDYIVPAIVVFYIISAVLGAVFKGLNTTPQKKAPLPGRQSGAPQIEQETMTIFDLEQPEYGNDGADLNDDITHDVTYTSSDDSEFLTRKSDFDEDDGLDGEDSLEDEIDPVQSKISRTTPVLIQKNKQISRSRLAEAIVMSEVVREPRAKRPWPQR